MAGLNYLDRESGRSKRRQAINTSAGAGDASKVVGTNASGKVDISFMPDGFGSETIALASFENLGAGDFINIFLDSGSAKVRKADNSNDRPANGFVKAAVTAPATATVYRGEGSTNDYTSLTVGGTCWLGVSGRIVQTAPSGSGVIDQRVGTATSATTIAVQIEEEFIL